MGWDAGIREKLSSKVFPFPGIPELFFYHKERKEHKD